MCDSLTTEKLARTRFGEAHEMFELHILVQFTFLLGEQSGGFLLRNQGRHPLCALAEGLNEATSALVLPPATNSMISNSSLF